MTTFSGHYSPPSLFMSLCTYQCDAPPPSWGNSRGKTGFYVPSEPLGWDRAGLSNAPYVQLIMYTRIIHHVKKKTHAGLLAGTLSLIGFLAGTLIGFLAGTLRLVRTGFSASTGQHVLNLLPSIICSHGTKVVLVVAIVHPRGEFRRSQLAHVCGYPEEVRH